MGNDREKQVVWSKYDDVIFIQTLKQQKALGNWGDNNPKKIAYTACEAALIGSEAKSGGGPKTEAPLRNRWQRVHHPFIPCICTQADHHSFQLKKDYEIVKQIRNNSGWSWDSVTLLPKVEPPVWKAYVVVRIFLV
jgi:hypothetical protein